MIYVLSGGAKLFAAIGATYPAGSTLTCTKGTKTLTAKNTSGQWVFAIPEAGTWTVNAGTLSKTVNITHEGQFESVVLSNALALIEDGVDKVGFKSSDSSISSSDGFVQFGLSGTQSGYGYYEIDVTPYEVLRIDGYWAKVNAGNGATKVEVYKGNSKASEITFTQTRADYTIDLSAISETVQIRVTTQGYPTDTQGWQSSVSRVYNMRLE